MPATCRQPGTGTVSPAVVSRVSPGSWAPRGCARGRGCGHGSQDVPDPPHGWNDGHAAFNGGRYDQSVPDKGVTTMTYHSRHDLPYQYPALRPHVADQVPREALRRRRTGPDRAQHHPWRRAVVGDLTTAFDFATPNRSRRLGPPDTDDFVPTDLVKFPDQPSSSPRGPATRRWSAWRLGASDRSGSARCSRPPSRGPTCRPRRPPPASRSSTSTTALWTSGSTSSPTATRSPRARIGSSATPGG
jgi:hypothetical protein